jgi:transcriptional regulator with XRE-family HTH domain
MTPFQFYKAHLKNRPHLEHVADEAGTSLAYLEQLCRGYRNPSIKLAKRLVRATDRVVPLEEWLPDLKDSAA